MRLSFICNPIYVYGEQGWNPESKRLGGSEEFIVEVGKRLAEQGHEVTVYHNGEHGVFDGVSYLEHADFIPGDITVNINYPGFKIDGKSIYWTSLTDNPDLSQFDAVCAISKYALENTNINHPKSFILPPGYDPKKIYPGKKIPKQCFYASSPDRGLSTLVEAWPEVYKAHPDATLIITYGGNIDLPGVINLGEVDEETMNDVYRTSDIWCHPCNGGELYCMTGVKAQAAGCVPVVIPTMALAETVREGFEAENADEYTEILVDAVGNYGIKEKYRSRLLGFNYPTWDDSTDQLLDIIDFVLN